MKEHAFVFGLVFCLSFFLLGLCVTPEANAQADPFYKAKTIRIVVGSTPGGFYDRWALVALSPTVGAPSFI